MSEQNIYQAPQSSISPNDELEIQPDIFSFSGRIGRLRYFSYAVIYSILFYIVLTITVLLAVMTIGSVESAITILGVAVCFIGFLAATLVLMRRRLNDLGHSGWFALLSLVPLINFLLGLYLLFAPGEQVGNEYGARPTRNHPALWLWLLGPFLAGIIAAISVPAYNDYVQRAEAAQQP